MARAGVRAVAAGVLGTTMAWYGFFLSLAAILVVFGPQLASPGGKLVGLLTVAAGFVGRPIGAAVFGQAGDRRGRTSTLFVSLLLMSLSTAAVGLLPATGHGLWIAAPLALLRLAQGAALGGEWAGAVIMAMEWAPRGRRGLVASLPQVGVPMGLLLSLLAVPWLLPGQSPDWAWRVPFLLVLVPMAVGWRLRRGLAETPEFPPQRETVRWPVLDVASHHWHEITLKARARVSADVLFYGVVYAVMLPAFALGQGGRGGGLEPGLLLACVAGAVTVPLAGGLSDRLGRGHVYGAGIALLAAVVVPYFLMLRSGSPLVAAATAGMLFLHAVQYGPQAALIGEAFTPRLRVSGAALSYHLGSIPSMLVPLAAIFVPADLVPVAIALVVGGCCILSASALVPPRRLLAAVVVSAVAGITFALPVLAAEPGGLGEVARQLRDPRSWLWGWINNGIAVAGLVALWFFGRRR